MQDKEIEWKLLRENFLFKYYFKKDSRYTTKMAHNQVAREVFKKLSGEKELIYSLEFLKKSSFKTLSKIEDSIVETYHKNIKKNALEDIELIINKGV